MREVSPPPIPAQAYAERRERVARRVGGPVGADAVLVTRLVNVRWLTGFSGSNAALLLPAADPGRAVLATDGRYLTQAAAEAPGVEIHDDRACAPALVARAARVGARRLAVETHAVTVDDHAAWAAAEPGLALVPLGRLVEELRAVKDDHEIALVRAACGVGDRALADLLPEVRAGRTERQVAARLEALLREHGGDGPAFETIVAGGEHSAIPHHRPTDRPLRRGDLLKIDFGARLAGYAADATRTFVVGAPPADWQREAYALVAAAQRAGRAAALPGADVVRVDAAARDVVAAAGRAGEFPHGLGHGIGLEIHEAPLLSPRGRGSLVGRMTVTVEPGVYLPGLGGVRIEDSLVVRDGAPDVLTTTPRDLVVLG